MDNHVESSGELPGRFREYLLVLARLHLGDQLRGKLDASDIVQLTVLEAHCKQAQFRGQSDAESAGWLRQMLACNLAGATIGGHSSGVLSLSWNAKSGRLASGANDGTIKIWDTSTGQEALAHRGHELRVWCVAWIPDGRRLASASPDAARVWDAPAGYEAARAPAEAQ